MTPRLTHLELRDGRGIPGMAPPARAVLCLGNFDGVHIAHRALLAEGRALAGRLRVPCGVFCFLRPSVDYLPRDGVTAPGHLTTLRDKLALFAAAGCDFVVLCDFLDVRGLSPDAFIHLLRGECGAVGVACGYNFRFGHRAAGRAEELVAAFGAKKVAILPEMVAHGGTVSASRIRECLARGEAATAAALLGRPYALTATVTHGKRLGRTIGFPTANQYFPREALIPAHGVYAALCHTPDGHTYPGVANVGCHPTVDTHARVNCETYLLDYAGDLYGQTLRIEFLYFLRPEERFSDLDALTAAIRRDAEAARAYIQALDP